MSLPEEWSWRVGPGGLGALWRGRTLASAYDPNREARRRAEALPVATLYVILGWGTGHLARALAQLRSESVVLALEPHPGRASAARQHPEWRETPDRVVFVEGSEVPYGWLMGFPPTAIHLLVHPGLEGEPEVEALQQACRVFLERQTVNSRTLQRFAGLWGRNLAHNLRRRDLETAKPWRGILRGGSAVIAAAGPTLEQALTQLGSPASRPWPLVAVDSAVAPLLSRGWVPDVVVSMDAQYWNARHLDHWSGTVVAELVSHPMATGRGRTVLLGSSIPPVADVEGQELPRLPSGGSVATAAAAFCSWLGTRSLLWLGLDLAWSSTGTHARPSLIHTLWLSQNERRQPLESLWLSWALSQPRITLPGGSGPAARVDQRLYLYAQWFDEAARAGLIPPSYRLLSRAPIPSFQEVASPGDFFARHPPLPLKPPRPIAVAGLGPRLQALRASWFAWREGRANYPTAMEKTWVEWLGPVEAGLRRWNLAPLREEWERRCTIVDAFFEGTFRGYAETEHARHRR